MTTVVIITALTLLLAYDVYALFHGGMKNTISWIIYSSSMKYPVIAFLGGLLAGHFWWGQVCG